MTHLMDGDLMRLLDGEAAGTEGEALRGHVDACVACAARLAELRQASDRFRDAVAGADLARPGPSRARRLAWAAGVVLVLGGLVGVEPVRAWIVDRTQTLWQALAENPAPVPQPAAPDPAPGSGSSVTFAPQPGVFRLEVATREPGGVLDVILTDAVAATAAVRGAQAHLVVLPGGLRIENEGAAGARYTVHLPRRAISALEVRLGAGAPVRIDPGLDAWRFDLATGDRMPVREPLSGQ